MTELALSSIRKSLILSPLSQLIQIESICMLYFMYGISTFPDVMHTYKGLWKSCYRKDKDMLTSCQAVSEGLASGQIKMPRKYLFHFLKI